MLGDLIYPALGVELGAGAGAYRLVDVAKSSPSPARIRPTSCRECGTTEGRISMRALCQACGVRRQTFAAIELHRGEGPTYDAWLAAQRRAIERLEASATG